MATVTVDGSTRDLRRDGMTNVHPRGLSLRANVAFTLVGNAVYLATQYAVLMTVSRWGTPRLVGHYCLALAICMPVVLFSRFQLRQLQVTDARSDFLLIDYLVFRLLATAGSLAVIAAIAWATMPQLAVPILLVGIWKGAESVSEVALGDFQRHERMDLFAFSAVGKGIAGLVAFAIVFWRCQRLEPALIAVILVYVSAWLIAEYPLMKRLADPGALCRTPSVSRLLSLLLLAVPLGTATAVQSFSAQVPRYVLQYSHGADDVGLFSIAAAPLSLGFLFLGALSQATLPRSARLFQSEGPGSFARLGARLLVSSLLVAFTLTGLLIAFGKPLLATLFHPEYVAVYPMVAIMAPILILGAASSFGSLTINASRTFSLHLVTMIAVTVVHAIVCWVLVPRWGIAGAAWSELVKYAVATVCLSGAGGYVFWKHVRKVKNEARSRTANESRS